METLIANKRKDIEDVSLDVETVFNMQGGGSLGAYECGIYKALANHGIKFDIVSGTSIGAINAAIIASNVHDSDTIQGSAQVLENFWLELSEVLLPLPHEYKSLYIKDESRALIASIYSAAYGNPKAFLPVWATTMLRAASGVYLLNYPQNYIKIILLECPKLYQDIFLS